ncbi:MAG: hypothetical protein RDV48_28000 [Candidatus Eremiobacteraeota bacterium]|nr:hypothetical protein [Candidatus Eremiobacteraeota bacterium]
MKEHMASEQSAPSRIDAVSGRVMDFLEKISGSYRLFIALYFVIAVLITVVLLRTGPVVITRYGHDVPVYMDCAWRVLNGQLPHADFQSILGALFFLILAAGMKLGGVSVWGIISATLMMFWLFSLWTWILAVRRLSAPLAFLYALAVGLFITGAYHLGLDYRATTYANLYNRYGYAMLFVILLDLFFPPRKEDTRQDFTGGLSTGFLLVCLLFIKVNFFTAACALLVIRAVIARPSGGWAAGFAAGLAGALVPMALFFRFDFTPVLRDYQMVTLVRGRSLFSDPAFVMEKMGPFALSFMLLPVYLILFSGFTFQPRGKIGSPSRVFALMAAVFLCGILLNLTNHGFYDMPMLLPLVFLPFEYFLLKPDHSREFLAVSALSILLIFLIITGSFYGKNVASIGFASANKKKAAGALTAIRSDALGALYVAFADGTFNKDYPEKLNEGLDLLKRHAREHDRIATLDFENPFPVGLGLMSPKGFYSICNFGVDFNNEHYIMPERAFHDTTLVMVPRPGCPESTLPLLRIYGSYIEKHFDFVESTERWMLLRKKP